MAAQFTTKDRRHLPPSMKILLPHHHQVPMTTPSVPASTLADDAAVLITEHITVDHTAMNAVAAGADAVMEAGVVAADAAVAANAVSIPGPPEATST